MLWVTPETKYGCWMSEAPRLAWGSGAYATILASWVGALPGLALGSGPRAGTPSPSTTSHFPTFYGRWLFLSVSLAMGISLQFQGERFGAD